MNCFARFNIAKNSGQRTFAGEIRFFGGTLVET